MSKKRAAIKILACQEDRNRIQGILEQLSAKGIRVSDTNGPFRKKDIVLVVLSECFYGTEDLRAQLFDLLAQDAEYILPLNMGKIPVPQDILNLLFSRNIITPGDRDDEYVAGRILTAIPEKKNTLPLILSAAAILLLAVVGMILFSSGQKEEPVSEIAATEPVPNPMGITQEELAEIMNVVIIGDRFIYHTADDLRGYQGWPDVYDIASESWEDEDRHWYDREDGHEYTLSRYDDLRFLELMPNLRRLRMVLVEVDAEMLPNLSDSQNLNYVSIYDCNIDQVEWIASRNLIQAEITGTNVEDYGPLTNCEVLRYVTIDGMGKHDGDLSTFGPPDLQELTISNLQPGETKLDALSNCKKLYRLQLDTLRITDLDFLKGLNSLEALIVDNTNALRDISAVSSLEKLKELRLRRCDSVADYTPIGGCATLETINIERDRWIPVDSSFLNNLERLCDIGLFGLNLNNMDFLGSMPYAMSLGFAGDIQDYSGLAKLERYQFVHVNPRSSGGSYGNYALVAPYLENASIEVLELYNCTNVDLERLPEVRNSLSIYGGDLKDLSGLSGDSLCRLKLHNMQYLRSLNGIEELNKLRKSFMELSILGCPRLTDLEALDGAKILTLNLVDTYTMPDFSNMEIGTLCLESILGMEDLSCLTSLDKNTRYQFEFPGMEDLKDLSVLRDYKGGRLYVPPQVADQAQELVDMGNFSSYEVCYPESGWNPVDEEMVLLSMEELETLPKAVLRRVSRVWIAGNEIVDPERYEIREAWIHNEPVPMLYDYETGEETRIGVGNITDFEMLSALTGLRELRMFNQPLENLEGIQYFDNLWCLEAKYCRNLTDASALYTLQGLEEITLSCTGIDSIQGVQNLPSLRCLGISRTNVTDLSPLTELNYDHVIGTDGFHLEIQDCSITDLSVLSVIPRYSFLCVYGLPAESWMPFVEQAEFRAIGGQMENDEMFKAFVQCHPELEEMHIEAGYQLTDLTPLLELQNLDYVHIWDGEETAARSLMGAQYGFRFDVG